MQLQNWKNTFPQNIKCPIWGTNAGKINPAQNPNENPNTIFSPRAGGTFILADPNALQNALQNTTQDQKPSLPSLPNLQRAISNWITENQIRNQKAELSTQTISQIQNLTSADPRRATGDALSVRERGDRILLLLDALATGLSQPVLINQDCHNLALAWSATQSRKALWFILRDLERQSCIDLESRISADGPQQFATIQQDGLQRVESMQQVLHAPAAKMLFAAMWAGKNSIETFEQAIAPAASANGLQAARLPRENLGNRPVGESLAAIRQARMVVVEMSGDPKHMAPGGLWFEAGFTAGLGIPVLWTCKDLEPLRKALALEPQSAPAGILFWKTHEDLKDELEKRIATQLAGKSPMTDNTEENENPETPSNP
ncbi:MAG: hypothetical protein OD811_04775 [Alphaproteobacteria bacterium]